MIKYSKTFISLLSMLAIAFPLTSCNRGEGESSSDSSTTSDSSSTSKSVEIEFWHTFGDKVESALESKIESFKSAIKEHDNVDVDVKLVYKGAYKDMIKHVTMSFESGDTPTIAVAYPDHVADYLYAEKDEDGKYVVNLKDFIDNSELTFGTDSYIGDTTDINDFVDAFIDEGTHYTKDGMYSLPYMKSTEVMFYNADIVKRALPYINAEFYAQKYSSNLTEGTVGNYLNSVDWDDFLKIGEIIMNHKKDLNVNDLEYSIIYDSDSNLFISKLYQKEIGYSSIDPTTKKGVIEFESGENRSKAEEFVSSLALANKSKVLATKGSLGEYASNYFKTEKAVFTIGSTGGTGYSLPEAGSFEVGICAVPSSNDNPLYVTQGPTLTLLTHPTHTKEVADMKKLYGWKLLKFLTAPENNVELCVSGSEGYLPVRKSSYSSQIYFDFIEDGGDYAKVADVVNNTIQGLYLNTPVFKGSSTLREQVGGIITKMLSSENTLSVSKVFDEAINNSKAYM